MAKVSRAPFTPLLSRAGRAVWWCGMPLLLVASIFVGHELYPVDALYSVANTIVTDSPLAAELIATYPLWINAMLLLTAVTVWSHYRRTAAVRPESLALPAYIGGLEACARLSSFFACRGGIPTTRGELHQELHVAAAASLVAMAAPLFLGALLVAKCPGGFSAPFSRRSLLPLLAATGSVALIWLLYGGLLRRYAPAVS